MLLKGLLIIKLPYMYNGILELNKLRMNVCGMEVDGNMKKLIIINGAPGVGKTSVCKELYKSIDKSVWLDGDWCWMMNPFIATEENMKMVEDNINFLLRNFLNNSSYEYVIFNWVIGSESTFNNILERLKDLEFKLYKISLLCSAEALKQRMIKDRREETKIQYSINKLKSYEKMATYKINTTSMNIGDIINEICTFLQ